MMTFAEYDARICNEDLKEYFHHLTLERQGNPQNETIKDVIAELQGIVIPGRLSGKAVIELREQNKVAADLAEEGKIEESLAVIEQIIDACPENYSAFYTLGYISFEQEDFEKAIECFKQAFEYNQFFTDVVLRIYDCCVCLGDMSDIGVVLNKALALQPSDPELLETKRHLEEGTYPERLAQHIKKTDEKKDKLRQELLEIKRLLEEGNTEEALEKLNKLV
ncbi:MAG: tetratricopeptide repeat protein [Fibromonadaceae bacterium]|jgi:tetratricopeptide (TPR) repeat protein|nr:tetratricopeptide repeat protein [Fibromonadaceae bacterium]